MLCCRLLKALREVNHFEEARNRTSERQSARARRPTILRSGAKLRKPLPLVQLKRLVEEKNARLHKQEPSAH